MPFGFARIGPEHSTAEEAALRPLAGGVQDAGAERLNATALEGRVRQGELQC
jgi:hypothetical protein